VARRFTAVYFSYGIKHAMRGFSGTSRKVKAYRATERSAFITNEKSLVRFVTREKSSSFMRIRRREVGSFSHLYIDYLSW
jgi:hypothetical protein